MCTIFERHKPIRISFFVVVFLLTLSIQAQHSIFGTFSPAKDYKWLIAYRLQPGSQAYIADTAVKDGEFTLQLPQSARPGIYRLVYAVPQEEFYFDVIYSGKEDIRLAFNSENGISFLMSEENILFHSYFRDINGLEGDIVQFYAEGNSDKIAFHDRTKKLEARQNFYEEKSRGTLANLFIKANRPYIPSEYEPIQNYVDQRKNHYFTGLDLSNPLLQASGFLMDKLTNYVFTALPLKKMSETEIEKPMQQNVLTVAKHLAENDAAYKFEVFRTLWKKAIDDNLTNTSDFIYNTYLKPLSADPKNQKTFAEIEIKNRLRIGAVAPEIIWTENNSTKKLSTMSGAEHYLLIFWSSTCSHCLKEIPPLHKELKNHPSTQVIAVGLEDDETTWKSESAKLPNFHHVLALGRWESEYANIYDIHQTPTFYLLNKDKIISAKPRNDREVIELLNK